jgi:hypothetical protein
MLTEAQTEKTVLSDGCFRLRAVAAMALRQFLLPALSGTYDRAV